VENKAPIICQLLQLHKWLIFGKLNCWFQRDPPSQGCSMGRTERLGLETNVKKQAELEQRYLHDGSNVLITVSLIERCASYWLTIH